MHWSLLASSGLAQHATAIYTPRTLCSGCRAPLQPTLHPCRPAALPPLCAAAGVLTDISVSIPSKGEGLQRVVLTFPHFSTSLDYDPTTALAGEAATRCWRRRQQCSACA